MINFPISGVETYWWLPALVAYIVSSLASVGGLSGAFLLLPFQMSFLGFTGPAVSSTNLFYNIVAIPSGVYRLIRENRMVWPLTWIIIIGTLPGMFLGAIIRIKYLPDPGAFKLFAGLVLLYIGLRLIISKTKAKTNYQKDFNVTEAKAGLKSISYKFEGEKSVASTPGILSLCFVVGIIGGTYGIGGGAIIAPFLVAVFRLPVYTTAGATLFGTFVTSIAGVIIYTLLAPVYSDTGLAISPDWMLGLSFGIGGALGIYTGARLQKYLPVMVIKIILTICLLFVAGKYIIGFFW